MASLLYGGGPVMPERGSLVQKPVNASATESKEDEAIQKMKELGS